MAFPSDNELKRMRKLLANVEGSTIIPKDAPKVERLKYEICQSILKKFEISKMSQKEFAIFLSIDEALVSKLLKNKIENFTIDRLLKYLEIVQPDYQIKLG